jgi:hypothetical protein
MKRRLFSRSRLARFVLAGAVVIAIHGAAAQQPALPDAPQPQQNQSLGTNCSEQQPANGQSPKGDSAQCEPDGRRSKNHIFWIIPNYRSEEAGNAKPLTPGEKFKLAFQDSFDPTAFLVAGVFAGTSMAQRQYAFDDGVAGFAQYYGTAFADQTIGNFMTEALFPIALHQDPRYFVKGKGGFWKRVGYAMSREVVTLGDDGSKQFNTSEIAGNSVAAGISNVYYPPVDRTFGKTMGKYGQQIGLDGSLTWPKSFGRMCAPSSSASDLITPGLLPSL